jgi:hypothetical protein
MGADAKEQSPLCTHLWINLWATPPKAVNDVGTALCITWFSGRYPPECPAQLLHTLWTKTGLKKVSNINKRRSK